MLVPVAGWPSTVEQNITHSHSVPVLSRERCVETPCLNSVHSECDPIFRAVQELYGAPCGYSQAEDVCKRIQPREGLQIQVFRPKFGNGPGVEYRLESCLSCTSKLFILIVSTAIAILG